MDEHPLLRRAALLLQQTAELAEQTRRLIRDARLARLWFKARLARLQRQYPRTARPS